jgi:hypothetical protein
MALESILQGFSGTLAEVDANRALKVSIPNGSTPADVGAVRFLSENDGGDALGTPFLLAPETDEDYRLRVAMDTPFDEEIFNYAAQNTGKYNFLNTTLAATWNTGGMVFNSGSITTTTTGARQRTYAAFPLIDPGTLNVSATLAFSAQPVANVIVDAGLFLDGGANPFAPTDGVYFRFSSSGVQGICNFNGAELTTGVVPFTYVINRRYAYLIVVHEREVTFWIDGVLYARLATPVGQSQPFAAEALPFAVRHAIVGGAAGGVIQATLAAYSVSIGGLQIADKFGEINNRIVGAYQGLSGGTMGSLANYANSADPVAAAALSNTAALVTGLGGQFRFNAAATAVTDGIVTSYQVPALAISQRNRRLKINGIRLSCVNLGAAVATTGTAIQWSLAAGHTAVSLATAEAAGAKAPRRLALGIMTWLVGAAIGQAPENGDIDISFESPVYVNPGEFVALAAKFILGTATASQVIWGTATFIHSWE